MQQTILSNTQNVVTHHTYSVSIPSKPNALKRFIQWCNKQEEYRFLWIAISLFGHIGMVLPLTLLSILFFADMIASASKKSTRFSGAI